MSNQTIEIMDNKLYEIANRFDIKGKISCIKPLKIGHINDSFIVTSSDKDKERKYFLQKINTNIFKDVEGLQKNISLVTNHIRQHLQKQGVKDIDRRVLHLVNLIDSDLTYTTDQDGGTWRMYDFVEDSHSLDAINADTAYLAGKAFGDFQNMLADIPIEEAKETIPNFHNMEFRLEEYKDAVVNDRAGRVKDKISQEIMQEIDLRAYDMCLQERLHREGKLPKRINHCDTKVNNMLLDENDKPLAIVDLDTVMPSFVLSDFGDFMRTGANTAAEDEADLDKIGVNFDVYKAFTKGYLEEATFLTDTEKELLPMGPRLLTYMQTVRFFTDYLNGDTYYKVAHPMHNLQRTLAQLRFLKELEANANVLESFHQS